MAFVQKTEFELIVSGLGYPEGPVAYFEFIEAWRQSGQFEGLEFR